MSLRKLSLSELNRLSNEEFRTAEKFPVTVILDDIRSQNNTGSVFRTCDAFRVDSLYLCGITATPPHREIHKTALGAEDSVNWNYFGSVIEAVMKARESGHLVLAVEQTTNSLSLQDLSIPAHSKIALVFGNEIQGVNEEVLKLADNCVEIPQFGTKHSINVSVAVGITLWEFLKKLNKI
ncbi:MAG: RNA methyltransferase [Bacteroidetes bacterium]|nr:RNA methyltransferase [Bacteroidota bacterium]